MIHVLPEVTSNGEETTLLLSVRSSLERIVCFVINFNAYNYITTIGEGSWCTSLLWDRGAPTVVGDHCSIQQTAVIGNIIAAASAAGGLGFRAAAHRRNKKDNSKETGRRSRWYARQVFIARAITWLVRVHVNYVTD